VKNIAAAAAIAAFDNLLICIVKPLNSLCAATLLLMYRDRANGKIITPRHVLMSNFATLTRRAGRGE
jgi:hypothetical protein